MIIVYISFFFCESRSPLVEILLQHHDEKEHRYMSCFLAIVVCASMYLLGLLLQMHCFCSLYIIYGIKYTIRLLLVLVSGCLACVRGSRPAYACRPATAAG